ncbi:hypothetical protein NQ314_019302 [Rhamnusium bicolor]|uniref:Uncharacterized protein n=1 Tax=Rhamnusium bicolor TaxID=1586634 RepID=A0AAV8WPF2_9CUCU|nr:hypothetical protein NQ314_019302 [Rhamnusium bicolor]
MRFNLTKNTKEEEIKVSNNIINKSSYTSDISKNYIHNDLQDLPPPQKTKIKSHFKRAISYFKNLEEKSLGKTKSKPLKKDCRRYSLDIQPNKNKNNKIGGSLNLPNVSERFSINNLYNDVFGNRKGSFKGAANQSALVEALATFSRKENSNFNEADEDDIKYNIFKRKAKSKKRRSVRSIFDVYY